MDSSPDQFLWVERFRPHKIADLILPAPLKATFSQIVAQGTVPNMILSGSSGIGKTSVALAMCEELGLDHILINGSLDRNLDTLRTKIVNYASAVSLSGGRKVVIIDEADYLNAESTQPAFRGVIEEFAGNCSFVFTVNHKNRLIPALHSRCTVVDFTVSAEARTSMKSAMAQRTAQILKAEGIEFDPKTLVELVKHYFPDFRRTLNELQRYSVSGKIDAGIFVNLLNVQLEELIKALIAKEWGTMRKWVAANKDQDSSRVIHELLERVTDIFKPLYVPRAVVILSTYADRDTRVPDKELNLAALCSELMIECETKEPV